jgi:hypothetical protein
VPSNVAARSSYCGFHASIKRPRSETATIYAGSPYQSKRLYKLSEGRVGTTAYQPIIGGHKW